MGFMFTNRTHAAGSNVETEILGTHGTLRNCNVGAKNLLNIVDEHGSREEYYPDFMSRWHEAFVAEMVAFTGHVRDNTKPADLTVYDAPPFPRLLTAARNPSRPARCCRFDKISIEKACHHRWQAFCYAALPDRSGRSAALSFHRRSAIISLSDYMYRALNKRQYRQRFDLVCTGRAGR